MKQVTVTLELNVNLSDEQAETIEKTLEAIRYEISKARDVLLTADVTQNIELTGNIYLPNEEVYTVIDGNPNKE